MTAPRFVISVVTLFVRAVDASGITSPQASVTVTRNKLMATLFSASLSAWAKLTPSLEAKATRCLLLILALATAVAGAAPTFTVRTEFPATDGRVNAIAVDEAKGVVYIGGVFTKVGTSPRNNLAALDLHTGALLPWNPFVNDTVTAVMVLNSKIYVGGYFTTASGLLRNRLAGFDDAGNATTWNPNADSYVTALVGKGSTIYASGDFKNIGGQPHGYLVAIDASANSNGTPTSWNPQANDVVTAMVLDGTTLYVGGIFQSLGGQVRKRIGAVDVSTGGATPWDPSADGFVYALALDNATVYVGGKFENIGGQNRARLAAIDTTGKANSWNPILTNGEVDCFAAGERTVYVGGTFLDVAGKACKCFAPLDPTTGDVRWNPDVDSSVRALARSGSTLFVGGTFSTIDGISRKGFAAVTDSTPISSIPQPSVMLKGKKKFSTSKTRFTLKGSASDTGGTLTRVEVKLGQAAFKSAKGTSKWTFTAKLKPGKNTLSVRAVDVSGAMSPVVKVTVTRK